MYRSVDQSSDGERSLLCRSSQDCIIAIRGYNFQEGQPVAVNEHGKDHLPQIRPMILAVAVLAQRLAAGTLKVQAGGVHEHQVEPREQIAPMCEQPLLHHVLHAPWRERRAAVLLLL